VRHDADWAKQRFAAARIARLATAAEDGTPHLVPITFTLVGKTIISAVDAKPKSTNRLRRLDNVARNPFVSVLVDEYDDDWSRLWWARADGWGRIREREEVPEFGALVAKYDQYRSHPPEGPVIVIMVDHWAGWSAR
jgi:PPOX class probable F420-dependent enzyme